ncbi:hypothetical protein LDENG_00206890 [Lucifuga dentata]|nr:hypothetical protein LDENG_00206890 [Lucifuga dentata]
MKKGSFCCCPSLFLRRETAHFYLLGVLIALYMLTSAAVFSTLERPAELQAHQLWERRLKDFSHEYNVSCEDMRSLLKHYEEARTAGIRTEGSRALWDFPGAFYFVGTVLSTIGFGVTAPSTTTGKVFLVFYGLLSCSATLLFFNLFLERVITLLGLLIFLCHRQKKQHSLQKDRGNKERGNVEWKPSMYQVTLILFCAVLLVACGAATLYSVMEGWSYFEALYFCFVAFSTVGFGDFVSCQRKHHEDNPAYQVANCLLMLLGVCCTYSLFNAISVIIKQALNWLLKTLDWMYTSHTIPQLRPLFRLCFPDSEPPVCCCENDALQEQQVQAFLVQATACCGILVPQHAVSKCLSDEPNVNTVCHRDTCKGITPKKVQGNCFPEDGVEYVRPLQT